MKVENLSKKFRIGKLRQNEGTLRDVIGNVIKYPFSSREDKERTENLWALRDVNFEVKQGEAFGIIGGNGAGKSTLLKILSRIIKPTSGRAVLAGRVGSLLEIGTGFHPDLTGRENIFLNGAVLGMRHSEVEKKFDEIVAFADLEKFLETPVKFYSSGMYARLAFAVAAHLEPEILIIDEVLAVGDAAFQEKCLGKMGEVAGGGRTVLFVSHASSMVEKLCTVGLYLEKGEIKALGEMNSVMTRYKADYEPLLNVKRPNRNIDEIPEGEGRFIDWKIINSEKPHSISSGENAVFEFTFAYHNSSQPLNIRFMITDALGRFILASENVAELKRGLNHIRWHSQLPLKVDNYRIMGEVYLNSDASLVDRWYSDSILEITSSHEVLPHIQGVVNVPTKFEIVQK
jgi:lipopolysaccharide transport system ATP-binding protein